MTTIRPVLVTAVLLIALAACGSDDAAEADDGGGAASDSGSIDDSNATPRATDDDLEVAGGSTLTVDGTTYELDVSDCEGSNTDSSSFPFPDNFSLSGKAVNADLGFNIARNGPADELFVQVGALEGDGDENGGNENLVYAAQMETLDFTVDGPDVSGSVNVRAIGPTRPYGDETVVDFDFDC